MVLVVGVGCPSLGELAIMSWGRIATFLIPLLRRLRNEKRDHWWQDELGKATALLKVMWWRQPSPAANITWFIWNWTITHTLYSEFIVILPTPRFNLDDLFLKNFLTRKWQMLIEFKISCPQGRMMKAGSMMISYQPLGDLPNFFRSIISNQAQTEKDIDFMLDELDRLGHDL